LAGPAATIQQRENPPSGAEALGGAKRGCAQAARAGTDDFGQDLAAVSRL
jgi:hypothetical protein